MTTKTYCDACGAECDMNMTVLKYRCHLDHLVGAPGAKPGYVDPEWNMISGRYIERDLCAACYNEIGVVALKKFYEIKSEKDPLNVHGGAT